LRHYCAIIAPLLRLSIIFFIIKKYKNIKKMENNILINSGMISFIYLLFKFLEMRFVIKQNKPFKELFRETMIVFLSVVVGFYLVEQVMPLKNISYEATKAFVGAPEF
jgi:uncharacterized membrane protein